MKLYFLQHGTFNNLKKKELTRLVHLIPYQELLKRDQLGIAIKDFKALEKLVFECTEFTNQFPFLKLNHYQGLSLNIFCVQKYQLKREESTNSYHLMPMLLSDHWNHTTHLQIDCLLDTPNLWKKEIQKQAEIKPISKKLTSDYHLLIILNLSRLLRSFENRGGNCTIKPYNNTCRSCLKYFDNFPNYVSHISTCKKHGGKGSKVSIKRPKNIIIHVPFVKCKFTHKKIKNVMRFKRNQSWKSTPPPLIGVLDFEQKNEKIDRSKPVEPHIPNNAEAVQYPLAYSLTFGSPYGTSLPQTLNNVVVKFLDEEKDNEKDFFMNLLLTLRNKFIALKRFIKESLIEDRTPKLKDLSLEDQIRFLISSNCSMCGRKFHEYHTNKRTKEKQMVKRAIHHLHFVKVNINFFSNFFFLSNIFF